jgi:hypothetical protein
MEGAFDPARLVATVGEDRLLYAGGGQRRALARDAHAWRERLAAAGVSAAVQDKVLAGNAARLFRLQDAKVSA